MYGINTEEDFQKFHKENLCEIERIRKEYLVGSGIKAFLAKHKAKQVLKKRVNSKAEMFGLRYNLDGMFMSATSIRFNEARDFRMNRTNLRGI